MRARWISATRLGSVPVAYGGNVYVGVGGFRFGGGAGTGGVRVVRLGGNRVIDGVAAAARVS